jgi:glycerol uptake facilitator-like aquaporin
MRSGAFRAGISTPRCLPACWLRAGCGPDFIPYVIAQLVGGVLAAAVLYLIVSGKADFAGVGGFASNGYGDASPGKYSLARR